MVTDEGQTKRGYIPRATLYLSSMVKQSRDLVLLGYTHKKLADFYNVNLNTIYEWKKAHPDFAEALNVDRDEYDSKVTRSLYELATGFEYVENKTESDSNEFSRKTTVSKKMPPNTAAIKMWLYNRRASQWKSEMALSQKSNTNLPPAPPLVINYSLNPPVKGSCVTIGIGDGST